MSHGAARRAWLNHERRVLLMALAAGLPGRRSSPSSLLWTGDHSPKVVWTLTALVAARAGSASPSPSARRVVYPLQTLSNLLAGLREGDSSIRARGAGRDDALGEVMLEANVLAETLREQRLGALEATALLRKVMEEIDVAVFTFDGGQRLRLINRAGERLLGPRAPSGCWRATAERARPRRLPRRRRRRASSTSRSPAASGAGRSGARSFRQGGLPHQLLVLTDVSRPLRDEERQAWQRLMRVLGHEINNSLAPIKSIAGSLAPSARPRRRCPPTGATDARPRPRGDRVARGGADAASPPPTRASPSCRRPRLAPLDIGALVRRVAGLETRLAGRRRRRARTCAVPGDGDQLEQLLINLVHNAVDAALETGGGVRVGWTRARRLRSRSRSRTRGRASPQTANLFVPVLHDQAGRLRHRPRAQPADRRRPRRHADARQPRGPARDAGRCSGCRVEPPASSRLARGRRRRAGHAQPVAACSLSRQPAESPAAELRPIWAQSPPLLSIRHAQLLRRADECCYNPAQIPNFHRARARSTVVAGLLRSGRVTDPRRSPTRWTRGAFASSNGCRQRT